MELATVLGWTMQTIRETPFRDVVSLVRHWHEKPPAVLLMRGFLMGEEKPKARPLKRKP